MVNNVTSLTGKGLRDWLLQRMSAIVLAVFVIFFAWTLAEHGPFTYEKWKLMFQCTTARIINTLVVFMILVHAWVGLWTVTTDYLNKCSCIRLVVQFFIALAILVCFFWALDIFWRV